MPHSRVERALLATLLVALLSPLGVAQAAEGAALRTTSAGDGDSWKASDGRTYRIGLVNAPELRECYGQQAAAYRRQRTQGGFSARRYATDTHGRHVAIVSAGGVGNLGVDMARRGLVDDRYLARYRSEHPAYARQLDAAFAEAKRAKRGLWGACRSATTPAPAAGSGGCHPDYATCVPVKGTGSGSPEANDLDCGDLRKVVQLRRAGTDPYRLDSNGDGVGCESYA